MSNSSDQERSSPTPGKIEREPGAEVTRRTVLAGAAAATVAATASGLDNPAQGQSAAARQKSQAEAKEEMDAFVLLSSVLTGIERRKLVPAVDPVNVKEEYLHKLHQWENDRENSAKTTFADLLRIAKDNSQIANTTDGAKRIIEQVQSNDDCKYLARSIVLMWYLGAWYKPTDLISLAEHPEPDEGPPTPFEVISSKAYTQGWVWRVAQAHPMGYSDLQFGYWSREPAKLEEFIRVPPRKGA